MDQLGALFAKSGAQGSTIKADKFDLGSLAPLAELFVERGVVFPQFVSDLLLLCHQLVIIDLLGADLFNVCVNHEVDGPAQHVLDGVHDLAALALVEELLGHLAAEAGGLLLHQLLLLLERHR